MMTASESYVEPLARGFMNLPAACNSTQSAIQLASEKIRSRKIKDPFQTQRLMQMLMSRGIWIRARKRESVPEKVMGLEVV